MGQWLSDRLGHPFVVENRPGANGSIAIETVIKGPADGYTLLAVALPDTVNATLYQNLNYNFIRDIAPVAATSRDPDVVVVNPSFPAKTVPEFINFAMANPGKINMASPGVGSSPHMAGELFKFMTGIQMTHVAYRGSAPALTDLLGGQVQMYFGGLPTTIAHVRSGKLRALAVSTARRTPVLPDVPALAETLPGYEASFWGGFAAPVGTPVPIIATLNREINAVLADSAIRARLIALGAEPLVMSPQQSAAFVADETAKWGEVIRNAGITPD